LRLKPRPCKQSQPALADNTATSYLAVIPPVQPRWVYRIDRVIPAIPIQVWVGGAGGIPPELSRSKRV